MGDVLSGMFTLNYLIPNLIWTFLTMIVGYALRWAMGKPLEVRRKGWFMLISFASIFLLISILSYSVKGPASPVLRGGIDQISVTFVPNNPNSAGILMIFHVRNIGTPSIVENYSLDVTPSGWNTNVHGTMIFIPKIVMITPTPDTPQAFISPFICGKEALYRKTSEPLANGSQQRGYLWYELPGLSTQSLKNPAGTKFHMTFSDVLGKTYTADFSWPAVSTPPGYMPGISVPNTSNPEEACN
jgi:hypothetical protein